MDIWENKNLKPMLIGADSGPFDDPDYLFELKLDGERCLAYLSKDGTELRNKRNMRPVSYTHLDVYKRQLNILGNTKRPLPSKKRKLTFTIKVAFILLCSCLLYTSQTGSEPTYLSLGITRRRT